MSLHALVAAAIATAVAAFTPGRQEALPASWLDRPLSNWNAAGAPLPSPPADDESSDQLITRCHLTPPRSTAAEKALTAAGWIPFWIADQQLVRDDVELVGGMRSADGMCRPANYNIFVFVGATFAGVLSPEPMVSRTDGSASVARSAPPLVAAEFARYKPSDALCCPSSRQTVRYRIDRSGAQPLLVPVDVRTTRQ